jgi:hypothetical protein
MSAKDKVVEIDSKKPKEQEDLKTQLPQEDLKESLSSMGSDMVKRVDSERIGKQVVDPREDSDVI